MDPISFSATSARWRVQLLGGMSVGNGAQTITQFGGRSVAALLARLALYPRRSHGREELIELLWPGVELDTGRHRLRQALFALRQFLEPAGTVAAPVLQADRSAVRVVEGALACDALEFEQAVREGRHADALALYRGELLPGHYDEWIGEERTRLESLHDRVRDVALAVRGEPGLPLTRTPAETLPPARVSDGPPLPVYLTRLFAIDSVGGELGKLVREHRLVSLLGPGGCGKTRLAVELAHGLRERPGRFEVVAFVPLVSCHTALQLLDMVLTSLRLPAVAAQPFEAVSDALAGRRVLLVLDNMEQLVDTAHATLARLLALLPELHVLATSRRALQIDGEREFVLAPLALPTLGQGLEVVAANPAVALFIDRARAVRPDFHLSERNLASLVELSHQLEGLPLAIELAACRVRSFAPLQMLERLRRSPGSEPAEPPTPRLDLLARPGPRAGHDPRHASMRRVIDWSWSLLAAAEARLLAALTVFHGGFSAAAAQHLCTADAPGEDAHLLLDSLVSHSLVKAQAAAVGTLRFELYEPIREFAAARAALDDPLVGGGWRAHHRAWALGWARALPQTAPLAEVRLEMPNLHAALASALSDGCPRSGVQLLLALGRVLQDVELSAAGLADAALCVERCGDPRLRVRGQALIGPLLYAGGQFEAGCAHAEAALVASDAGTDAGAVAAAGDEEAERVLDRVQVLLALARVRWRSTRVTRDVDPLIDEAQGLLGDGASSDPILLASLHALRAAIASRVYRDHDAAEALYERALTCWVASGNRHAVNSGLYSLAVCAQDAGHHALSLERLDRVIADVGALDDRRRLSQALNARGNALCGLRRWPAAVTAFRDSLREAWAAMALYEVGFALWNLPRALAHVREPRTALRLLAFAERFWTLRFGALTDDDRFDLRRVHRLTARQLDGPSWRAEWQLGQALELPAAVALALALALADVEAPAPIS